MHAWCNFRCRMPILSHGPREDLWKCGLLLSDAAADVSAQRADAEGAAVMHARKEGRTRSCRCMHGGWVHHLKGCRCMHDPRMHTRTHVPRSWGMLARAGTHQLECFASSVTMAV